MTLVEMHVKWSVTLTDRLGPEILTVLEIKGQVLHRVRLHVKVSFFIFGDGLFLLCCISVRFLALKSLAQSWLSRR